MLLSFNVQKQIITRTDTESVVCNSMNFLYAQFTFSEEWTGTKTAVFKGKEKTYNALLDENDTCLVPWEVLTESWFYVSVFCGDLVTANKVTIYTIPSGYEIGDESRVPTPEIYIQVIEKLNEIESEVDPDAIKRTVDDYIAEKGLVTEDDVDQIVADYVEAHKSEWTGSVVSVTQTLSSGTKIGSISVDGTNTDLFAPQGGGGASSLSDLSDTSISSPSSGDVLVHDGAKWVNDTIGNVDIIPPVHNSGEYASTFGQGTATVKSDGSVDYESSSTSWNGPFFDISGNGDVSNTITIHVNNISSATVFSLYAKNVNGQPVSIGFTTAIYSSSASYSFILTPEEISEKNLRVPFNIGITKNVPISYNVSMEGTYGEELTVADVKNRAYFPLKGKKVIFLGDSITAFTNSQSWVEKFLDITETKKVVNVASISAVLPDYSDTVYDGNPSPSTQHNNTLGNQVQKIINNAYEAPDLIIIAIGTNSGISATDEQIKATYVDSSNNKVPLSDLDKTTSAGAFRYCNETLHNLYPDAKIVWCSPIQGASRYPHTVSSWDDTLDKLTQNGVVYHIHTNRCGIFFANETSGQNGEYLQDGLHPNEAGAWKIANYNASEIIRLFV